MTHNSPSRRAALILMAGAACFPAAALKRLLAEKPSAAGLAVPGMPIGSPGMEGGTPEPYDVILFGPAGRRTYMRFLGEKALG